MVVPGSTSMLLLSIVTLNINQEFTI